MRKKYSFQMLMAFAIFALTAFAYTGADAQVTYPDSKGKDFWLAFLPNYHNNINNPSNLLKYGDSLYIFIAAERATKGTITYTEYDGTVITSNFQITDPKDVYIFRITFFLAELRGFNRSGEITFDHQCEKIRQNTFHVTADDDITIYGHTQAVTTSEAFITLPTDALGKNYLVLTYNADDSPEKISSLDGRTPSQFAIVATEDNTDVTITPSSPTYINKMAVKTVLMNKGDVYLVQSDLGNYSSYNQDLTGSEITATKPVAVFAGQQRATVPVSGAGRSRDCLVEQMPPVESWGTNAILVPFQSSSKDENYTENDKYRILAAYDGTILDIGGYTTTINKGEFYEDDLTEAAYVKASAPILVMEYKKTSGVQSNTGEGDPLMMIIPPVEQFGNFYRCINVQVYEWDIFDYGGGVRDTSYRIVYDEQYITIVTPKKGIDGVKIDGVLRPASVFRQVPNSQYYYYHASVSDGVHVIEARDGAGIYVYGYGIANSYGYFGGMNFRKLDYNPPNIQSNKDCFHLEGTITDSTMNDSGIMTIDAPTATMTNIDLKIDTFTPKQKIVSFSSKLIDSLQDGTFTIMATDSAGLYSKQVFEIPGFTVGVKNNGSNPSPVVIRDSSAALGEICFDIEIENYGKFQQNINTQKLLNNDGKFYIKSPTNVVTLLPGQSFKVTVCYKGNDSTGTFTDTLVISNPCMERKAAVITIIIKTDTDAPSIQAVRDPCGNADYITVADNKIFDTGIKSVTILDSTNCTVIFESNDTKTSKLKVDVKDKYLDAIYEISTTDNSGKSTSVRDTIQGFTLLVSGNMGATSQEVNFGNTELGYLKCDTFTLKNYGFKTIVLKDPYVASNISFSLPQSQLPIELKPGESRTFEACYKPFIASTIAQTDSINFEYNCIGRSILLSGVAEELIYDGNSKCGVAMRITLSKVSNRFYLGNSYPNPAINSVTFKFGIPQKTDAEIIVADMFGQIVMRDAIKQAAPGEYEYSIDVSNLTSGVYTLMMNTQSDSGAMIFSVAK